MLSQALSVFSFYKQNCQVILIFKDFLSTNNPTNKYKTNIDIQLQRISHANNISPANHTSRLKYEEYSHEQCTNETLTAIQQDGRHIHGL
jgi:hypothetical protein